MNISRKDFLKKSALGAGIAALSLSSAADASENSELATLIDLRKCIGCEACVYACQEANAHKYPEPAKPFPKMYPERVKVSDWSDKRDVTDRLTPYNWLYIQRTQVEHDGKTIEVCAPRRCMHCQEPPCAHLCPFGAAHKQANGATTIDPDICLGGAKCNAVCPWNIPQRQTGVGPYLDIAPSYMGNGVMYKCDRCVDRLDKGQLPACIEACPEGVQKIGPRDHIADEARRAAKEEGAYIYGLEENGGTNTIYVSAVPFEKMNNAIASGQGNPHMDKVASVMKKSNILASALIIAPFAGAAASLLRIGDKIKKYIGETRNETEKNT
ncbi:MAG TPA: 4Fe-4S dicluster domain-containing protein [Spirochaetota bacterium]|nr:4Fe-4S dicluster domain-containing protein [Spirochaetota bacterium]HSA14777.1 4Fe-4S dicluster domain-containing protein [Spirochaetota bacterium]